MNALSHPSKVLNNKFQNFNQTQFKAFYSILVHCWSAKKAFISKQNFFNLWCELNKLCHEADESFPDQYDDHELVLSYCNEHPYYFIYILDLDLIKKLFWKHFDNRLDVLEEMLSKLDTEGIWAACECVNKALGLNDNVDDLVADIENYLKAASWFYCRF